MPLPTAIEKQKEVATLAASGERVARRMLARLDQLPAGALTITQTIDEYIETGHHMTRESAMLMEYHSMIAGGDGATRDELIHLAGHLSAACRALAEATAITKAIVDRITAADARASAANQTEERAQ